MKNKYILVILFSYLLWSHQAVARVSFLLQSIQDTDKVVLLTESSKANILYVNASCKSCFDNISKLVKNSAKNFIIVVGKKPIARAQNLLEKYGIPKNILDEFYLDPGFRLINRLKIFDQEATLISFNNGKITKSTEVLLSKRLPTLRELKIWQ